MSGIVSQAAPSAVTAEVVADTPMVLPTNDNNNNLLRIRHSSAHVMAMAVQRLYPDTKVTIGPWIDNGFYYDFDRAEQFVPADLKKIHNEMGKIIRAKLPLIREEVSREEAARRIKELNEPYKLEILEGIKDDVITIYKIGEEWWDLCAGPHVDNTGDLSPKAIQLQSLAGAYWRGDEKKAMLQRIYGTAWESADQLKEYKRKLELAKTRDHRVLGKKQNLFSIQEDAGGGLVFWHPKGAVVRRRMETFWKDAHEAAGYDLLYTPHIANIDLWKTSGHFSFYKEGMFDQMEVESEQYQIKPMNCPFHVLIYKDALRSYRELPLRWAELGTVYRYERSGTLHGLFRVRGFTQDDAHIFCLPEQLSDEILGVLDLTQGILTKFGFTQYDVMLSTRPEKSVGSDDIWDKATDALKDALQRKGWGYTVNEGDGAFYGPKIDIKITDAIGRSWQCSTIQCDFNLPERFKLEYVAPGGARQQPIMLHRAIFGSIERFFGILLESCGGDFPFWLAPVQLRLLPVLDAAIPHCREVQQKAQELGLKVEVDVSGDRLGKMVRNAEQQKVAVMAVVGEKEIAEGTLALRGRKQLNLGDYPLEEALSLLAEAANPKEPKEVVEITGVVEAPPKEEAAPEQPE